MMTGPSTLRVGLCQLDLSVGNLVDNAGSIIDAYRRVSAAGADVAVFPELAICGYPPDDLLSVSGFSSDSGAAIAELASQIDGHCAAVVGWVERGRTRPSIGKPGTDVLWNAAAVLHAGSIVGSHHKRVLGRGPLDDARYFESGAAEQAGYVFGGVSAAISIGAELWVGGGRSLSAASDGADVVLNLGAVPFFVGERHLNVEQIADWAKSASTPVVHVNMAGAQDESVFDGGSLVIGADGNVSESLARFDTRIAVFDVEVDGSRQGDPSGKAVHVSDRRSDPGSPPAVGAGVLSSRADDAGSGGPELWNVGLSEGGDADSYSEIWAALVVGLRDYVTKSGFSDVGLGLSGGVDSSIVAAVAVDAIGSDRVHGVLMPSRYSSDHSVADAEHLATNLGIETRTVPIEAAHLAFSGMLQASLNGPPSDLTDQNLQSRIRGMVLMALSNHLGWLILTTGNRSETAVGYSTLYGDTAGGFAAIKDVSKTLVYALGRWRNAMHGSDLIPESVLTKAPSAELRPGQRDDQSLPPYDVLDPLIDAYLTRNLSESELIAEGFGPDEVSQVLRLIGGSEFKRRQEPIGVRLFRRGFGSERRMPITNGY